VPGVLGNEASAVSESFSDGLLEEAHYTRPADFRGWVVPEVLRSGDHARVARWRRASALARTLAARPDLIDRRGGLDDEEVRLLREHGYPVPSPRDASPSGPTERGPSPAGSSDEERDAP
jgi:tRNA (guanine37-N1)-methyltransferase